MNHDPAGSEGHLTHLDERGRARMVDVSDKQVTTRMAVAEGWVRMASATLDHMLAGKPKGEPVRVAELAGIQAAKRTSELIPLCHLLPAVSVSVELTPDHDRPGFHARATARVQGSTGVEMEALTAVSIALLTIYDMGKSMDRGMVIDGVRLLEKSGGQTGTWRVSDGESR